MNPLSAFTGRVKFRRKTILATALLATMSAGVNASDQSVELSDVAVTAQATDDSMLASTATLPTSWAWKYRPAPWGTAISGQYIIVLKDEAVSQQASIMAGGMSAMADASVASEFKAQAVYSAAESMMSSYGGEMVQQFSTAIAGFVSKMDVRAVKAMMQNPMVEYIEQDSMVSISATQNNATWGLDRIDQANLPLDDTYTYNYDGSGVDAYIVDTGIRATHSDFGGRVDSQGFTAINDGRGSGDCNGHGTHVAGTVGSTTWGVAKNVNLIPVRVLGCNGSGSNSGVIAGVDWIADNASGPSVANMSLGGGASSALDRAIRNAVNKGVTFVVAAGNENQNACNVSPAREPVAITVGSSTSSDGRSSFSNWGSCVDIFAPGSSITSTWSTGNSATRTISGTSMASPHVAGVAALYLDQNPSASPADVEQALESRAATNKISNVRGSPNLLLQSLLGGSGNPPGPTPTPTPTPPPPGGPEPIDARVDNIDISRGAWARYYLDLTEGYSQLQVVIGNGSGDADLYVTYGRESTTSSYNCRPYRDGNSERCTFNNPPAGRWHIDIRGYRTVNNVDLRVVAE